MLGCRQRLRLGIALISCLAVACGSGAATGPDPEYQKLAHAGIDEPDTELERQVLAALPEMEPGVLIEFQGGTAVAGREYAAASGRTCRELTLDPASASGTATRLACLVEGTWSLVPDVLAPEAAAEEPTTANANEVPAEEPSAAAAPEGSGGGTP